MKYNKRLLQGIFQRIIGSMSGLADLKVNIVDDVVPNFNPTTKTIEMPPVTSFAKDDEEDFVVGRGTCVHEGSHTIFLPTLAQLKRWLKTIDEKDKEYAQEWLNVFADNNNEYKISKLFPNLKKALKAKTEIFIERNESILTTDHPFMQVLMRTNDIADIKPDFPKDYDEVLKTFINETVKKYRKNKMNVANGSKLLKFVKGIQEDWRKVKDKYDKTDPAMKMIQGLNKQLGDAIKDGDDALIEEIEGMIDEEGKKRLKGWKEKMNKTLVRTTDKGGTGELSELTIEELTKMLKKIKNESPDKKGGKIPGQKEIKDPKITRVFPKYYEERKGTEDCDQHTAYREGKQIHQRLKKKIQLAKDHTCNQRSGLIDIEEIRTQVSKMGRIYKPSLFKRPDSYKKGGAWAVSVLIDCSGSMTGQNMIDAKQALFTLAYAFDGLPMIKYELVGFTTTMDEGTIDIKIKEFSERKLDTERLKRLHSQGGNADGINIRAAFNRIKKVKGNIKKRLMIVISDGEPAYTYKGKDGNLDMADLVKSIQRTNVSIIGIGIPGANEKRLQKIYPNNFFFENTANLDNQLARIILKAVNSREKKQFIKAWWDK